LVVAALSQTDHLEGATQVLEPKPRGDKEPVQARHKAKTGVRSKAQMVPAREMDPDRLVERHSTEG
jgi:hypothetical protein